MLRRLTATVQSILHVLWRTARDSRFGHLVRMLVPLSRRASLLAVLLGLALVACLVLAGIALQAAFTWLGGWRWPHLLLSVPAAILVGVFMTELYAATILAVIGLVLRLGYDIGRARFSAVLTLIAACAVMLAGAGLWSEQAMPAASGPLIAAAIAIVLAALALWFVATYLRPATRGFRNFHVDLVEARQALDGARHGA